MTELKAGHHTLGRASSWLGWMALMVILAVCGPAAAQPFVHPGILNNRAELDFVKGKIKAEAEPWKAHWNKMRSLPISRLTVKPPGQCERDARPLRPAPTSAPAN